MFANILKVDNLLFLILSILATYRIAQLIAYDDAPFALMERFRTYLGKKAAGGSKYGIWWSLAELIHCPYCIGLWIALLFALFSNNFLLYWLAIAGGQSFLENITHTRGE
ncbi:unnamed protein product [marine sediment metagenome]|uniref:DUF1360 domain-containing protein n=1 Tax=marine sediment metagenome TaxID=412755 RepID=X0Y1E4_9ZZZZ